MDDTALLALDWMAWTPVTAAFFIGIALLLSGMTAWELIRPTRERKGFLPITTTRGDRFFIGLLSAAFIHLFWLGLTEWTLWGALALAAANMAVLLRYG
jgi:predicted small integral membrane protein